MPLLNPPIVIKADIRQQKIIKKPVVTQNDSVILQLEVLENGLPYDLTGATTVSLANKRKSDSVVVVTPGTFTGNIATFNLGTNELEKTGEVYAKAQFYDADDRVSTLTFSYVVEGDPTGAGYVPSVDEMTLIEAVMNDAQQKIDELSDVDVVALSLELDATNQQLAETSDKIGHIVSVADFGVTGNGTEESLGVQEAINFVSSLGGGTVDFGNESYIAQGLQPKHNVTLRGTGATTIKLPEVPSNHLIYYNNESTLDNFNLSGINFSGSNQIIYDIVHITEPTPLAPSKTWQYSVVDNCVFEYARTGIFCPVPGSVKINNSIIRYNDVGLKQLQEHFYLNNTVIWQNRIGADIDRANHFTWTNAVFAHNTEAGVVAVSTTNTCFESVFIGCSFIDNGGHAFKGRFERCRFIGCRILQLENGFDELVANNVVTGCYFKDVSVTAIKSGLNNSINGNVFMNCGTAIYVRDQGTAAISGNTFKQITQPILIGGNNVVVTGNIFDESKQSAIKCVAEGSGSALGMAITNNVFVDSSVNGLGLFPHIEIFDRLTASILSNNMFRERTKRASYAVWMNPGIVASEVIVMGNVARNMNTGGYHLDTGATATGNIGVVTTH